METVFQVMMAGCAFWDIHKETVEATVRILQGQRVQQETRRWGTTPGQIQAMADWLATQGGHAGGDGIDRGVLETPLQHPGNPLHGDSHQSRPYEASAGTQKRPARLAVGRAVAASRAAAGSFIPPRWQRELRDYTRYRSQLQAEPTRVANRLHKVLEDAHIKLGSVATDILGMSGRAKIHALMEGEQDAATSWPRGLRASCAPDFGN